mmetsp:Transcript_14283/g.21147  ORF Transcript_14283/g.21147 Transcript_14283/m.21147 type:complete len:205 (+) Transcript_14283:131-745(+)
MNLGKLVCPINRGSIALPTHTRLPIRSFVFKKMLSPESSQVCIINSRWNRNSLGTPGLHEAHFENQLIQLIRVKSDLIPQNRIFGGPRCSLQPTVTTNEKIELVRVAYCRIDHCSRWDISTSITVPLVNRKQASVVALLTRYESDPRPIFWIDALARILHRSYFKLQNLSELPFTGPISQEDNIEWPCFIFFKEQLQQSCSYSL